MRWIEIINARMAVDTDFKELERVFKEVRNGVMEGAEKNTRMVVYRCRFVETDWVIHLHRESHEPPDGRTGLGKELANMIRPMGLVDHSIWVEKE